MSRKITKGPIAAKIQNANSNAQRALVKAQELSKASVTNFVQDGYNVTITQGPEEVEGVLKVAVDVMRGNKTVEIDNPLLFVNPPTMVIDGQSEETIQDPEFGEITKMVNNFKEDPEQALKDIIIQVVKKQDK